MAKDCGGLTELYEKLAPKTAETETADQSEPSPETESESEPLASDAPALRHLYSEFIQKAHEAGYTNDEIKEFIATI
jgi:DNA-binding transcriptional regulator YhcF (GntR family)